MALIIPLHGQMSGSIGDNVYSHNKGGTYVRRRAVPVISASVKASQFKAILGSVSSEWNTTLTTSERTAWSQWAEQNPIMNRLGTPIEKTGQQAFVGLNTRLVQSGLVIVPDPPQSVAPVGYATLTATLTAPTSFSVAYTDPLAGGQKMLVWATLPNHAGVNPNVNQARLIGYSAADDPDPVAITSPYPGAAGDVVQVWCQRMGTDGQVSAMQSAGRITFA